MRRDTHESVIAGRLRYYLDQQDVSASQLARKAQLKPSFLYDILNGKSTNPSIIKLNQIAEALGVKLHEFIEEPGDVGTGLLTSRKADNDAISSIPPLDGQSGQAVSLYMPREWMESNHYQDGTLFSYTICSDIMAPTLMENDIVMVNTAITRPAPSGLFILRMQEQLIAKRLELLPDGKEPRLRILPDNPAYSAYIAPASDVEIIGKVIWVTRRIG